MITYVLSGPPSIDGTQVRLADRTECKYSKINLAVIVPNTQSAIIYLVIIYDQLCLGQNVLS